MIAIEYTTYREMALERMADIREEAFAKCPTMTCLHVHHSLGTINTGGLCFFVLLNQENSHTELSVRVMKGQ